MQNNFISYIYLIHVQTTCIWYSKSIYSCWFFLINKVNIIIDTLIHITANISPRPILSLWPSALMLIMEYWTNTSCDMENGMHVLFSIYFFISIYLSFAKIKVTAIPVDSLDSLYTFQTQATKIPEYSVSRILTTLLPRYLIQQT